MILCLVYGITDVAICYLANIILLSKLNIHLIAVELGLLNMCDALSEPGVCSIWVDLFCM